MVSMKALRFPSKVPVATRAYQLCFGGMPMNTKADRLFEVRLINFFRLRKQIFLCLAFWQHSWIDQEYIREGEYRTACTRIQTLCIK